MSSPLRVLVVDHDTVAAARTTGALRGVEGLVVSGVVPTLARATGHLGGPDRPDLVIAGVDLPDAPPGPDALGAVRALRSLPTPPVVVVRGDGRLEPDAPALLDAGAAAWLQPADLVATRLPGELLRAHVTWARLDTLTRERDVQRRRAEDLETYARTAWHDLRSPISTLAGYARALGMLLDDPDGLPGLDVSGVTDRIMAHADRALRFADELLAEAMDDLGACVVQVDDLVHDVLSRQHGHDDVTVLVETAPARVHGRPGAVRQTLHNLLENALQHAGSGGAVLVRVTTDADGVEVTVEDTGPGIPPEQRREVFALGATSRDGGHGIGLHTVQRMTRALGGRVRVEDGDRLEGARFVVDLPPVRDVPLPAPVVQVA